MGIARKAAARLIARYRDARADRAEHARLYRVIDQTIDQVVASSRTAWGVQWPELASPRVQPPRPPLQVDGLAARQAAGRQRETDAWQARRSR